MSNITSFWHSEAKMKLLNGDLFLYSYQIMSSLPLCSKQIMNIHVSSINLDDDTERRRPRSTREVLEQGRTGPAGNLAPTRWAGWSVVQFGRHIKCWSTG